MSNHYLVIDTNVFYTFIDKSSYREDHLRCIAFLFNILEFCENCICTNKLIKDQLDKFINSARESQYYPVFLAWYKEMNKKHKFKPIHPYPHIEPDIHRKDLVFYQTAFNTGDKVVITCEEKHHEKKDIIFKNHGITILKIHEANDLITENHIRYINNTE